MTEMLAESASNSSLGMVGLVEIELIALTPTGIARELC